MIPPIYLSMPITRVQLEQRLADAKQQLDTLKEQFAATQGVIADLEYWLIEEAKPAVTADIKD